MTEFIAGLTSETWVLLLEMSPYLLLGFFCAGVLHAFLPKEKVLQHLSGDDFPSVVKASLLGTPLPLCSCGVIPVVAHLSKQGASRGASLSFLTSTPNTGVDSIIATYGMMGPAFAILRPITAFFSGIFAGVIGNIFIPNSTEEKKEAIKTNYNTKKLPWYQKLWEAIQYGFIDVVRDTKKWLLIGILLGGIISYALPNDLGKLLWNNPLLTYPAMMLVGLPMYVCSTGSIPIATALLIKGMSPGAVLVFLIVGPATNSATMSYVGGKFGSKTLWIYILTMVISAFAFGLLVDYCLPYIGFNLAHAGHHHGVEEQGWFAIACTVFFLGLICATSVSLPRKTSKDCHVFIIPRMTCQSCVKKISSILEEMGGVEKVDADLVAKKLYVYSKETTKKISQALESGGYQNTSNP